MPAELLAIVSVSPDKRVRCRAPNCGHSVYAAVHIVRDAGLTTVLGSVCSGRLFGFGSASDVPRFGGTGGRMLTDEERDLLDANTEELLQRFQAQAEADEAQRWLAEYEREAREAARKVPPPMPQGSALPDDDDRPWSVEDGEQAARAWVPSRSKPEFTHAQLREAMQEVRAKMRAQGARPESIARDGLVRAQAVAMLERRARQS
jgi:hypothetical protein